jgi:uncharacterized membrane protein YhhN
MLNEVILALSVGAFLSGAFSIYFQYKEPQGLLYIFKPLTLLFIIAIALSQSFPPQTHYQRAIILGLIFSLAGDLFLVNHERFIHGLVSFLIAHLFYIAAFILFVPSGWLFVSALPVLACLALMLWALWSHLGKMKIPVVIYTIVIALMGWQSLNRWFLIGDAKAALATFGALLFMVSDSILAINKFKYNFRTAQLFLLTTYFIAQWLIALSV